jgi:hypothetical protein
MPLQRRSSDKGGLKTGPYEQCPAYPTVFEMSDTLTEIKGGLKEVKEMLGVWKDTKAVGRFFKFSAKVLLGLAGIGGAIAAIWSGGLIVIHKFWP